MPQLPQTTRGYRKDNGGDTQPPWMRSKRYCCKLATGASTVLTRAQILSQDLEQADPTVYQIIEKVRNLPIKDRGTC
jgi:hypothetical protein